MIDYDAFKKVVEDSFMKYMPEDMQDMKLAISQRDKVNVSADALSVMQEEWAASISPVVYINEMYADYVRHGDLDGVIRAAAHQMQQAMKAGNGIMGSLDMGAAKDNIVFQLINTEQNRSLLAGIPSRPFLDLSIIYRWVIQMDGEGIKSMIVSDRLAEHLGFTEEQLHGLALLNTRRLFPPASVPMEEAILKISRCFPVWAADISAQDIPKKVEMWLLTNTQAMYGAVSMMYEDELQAVADQLGDDLYILPSSLHELIAVPASPVLPDGMAGIVHAINMEEVELEERLSNQVYHYDRAQRKLTLATDTPNKRLEGYGK